MEMWSLQSHLVRDRLDFYAHTIIEQRKQAENKRTIDYGENYPSNLDVRSKESGYRFRILKESLILNRLNG